MGIPGVRVIGRQGDGGQYIVAVEVLGVGRMGDNKRKENQQQSQNNSNKQVNNTNCSDVGQVVCK